MFGTIIKRIDLFKRYNNVERAKLIKLEKIERERNFTVILLNNVVYGLITKLWSSWSRLRMIVIKINCRYADTNELKQDTYHTDINRQTSDNQYTSRYNVYKGMNL